MLTSAEIAQRKLDLAKMRKEFIIEELIQAEDTISRKEMAISDNVDRLSELKGQLRSDERIVVAQKKQKGKMDKMAMRKWLEFTKLQIIINLLSAPSMMIAAAMQDEFSIFMVGQALINAIAGPAIFYYQKKQESFG